MRKLKTFFGISFILIVWYIVSQVVIPMALLFTLAGSGTHNPETIKDVGTIKAGLDVLLFFGTAYLIQRYYKRKS